jgi:hypothetical protein
MKAKEYVEVDSFVKVNSFLLETCPSPNDRMFRASDNTWWKREGMEWLKSTPPDSVLREDRISGTRIGRLLEGMTIADLFEALTVYKYRNDDAIVNILKKKMGRAREHVY